jgi:hypothetical protein
MERPDDLDAELVRPDAALWLASRDPKSRSPVKRRGYAGAPLVSLLVHVYQTGDLYGRYELLTGVEQVLSVDAKSP